VVQRVIAAAAAAKQLTYMHTCTQTLNAEEGNPPGGGEEEGVGQGTEQQQGEGAPDGMIRPYFEVPWYRTHHLQQVE
jgi:hypothetical protein